MAERRPAPVTSVLQTHEGVMGQVSLRAVISFLLAFLISIGTLIAFPEIDLAASRFFYTRGLGFFNPPVLATVHSGLRYVVVAIVLMSATLFLWPRHRRKAIFFLAALALGPGLLINTVFKDHWGRARPSQIVEFGGTKVLTPPFVPADQCRTNCSFPAGDPAIGFFLVSGAFLIERATVRRWTIAAAIVTGGLLGFVRISQGGHFLSDVVASGFLVTALSWTLYRVIIAWDGLGALLQAVQQHRALVGKFVAVSIVSALASAVAYEWLDLPVAIALHGVSGPLQSLMRVVTAFGLGAPYLILSGLVAGLFWIAGPRVICWQAIYLFLAIAGSGLLADLIKPIAGRARPKLWFADHIYGFTGFGPHADYWSFPSGHSVTAGALVISLSVIVPRLTVVWSAGAILICASRILLDEHYFSDVIAGFYIGIVSASVIAVVLRANGIVLGLPNVRG